MKREDWMAKKRKGKEERKKERVGRKMDEEGRWDG